MATLRRRKPNCLSKLENLSVIDKIAQRILDDMLNNQELTDFASRHALQRMRHNPNNTVVCARSDVEELPDREYIIEDTEEEQLYYGLMSDVTTMVLQRALFRHSENILMPPSPCMHSGDGQDAFTYEEFVGEDNGH
jgi:hypothetical protein